MEHTMEKPVALTLNEQRLLERGRQIATKLAVRDRMVAEKAHLTHRAGEKQPASPSEAPAQPGSNLPPGPPSNAHARDEDVGEEQPQTGRCLKCKAEVELGETFFRGPEPHQGKEADDPGGLGARLHREGVTRAGGKEPKKHAAICGPVVTEFHYHVAFWFEVAGRFGIRRAAIPTPEPIDENPQGLEIVEAIIADKFTVRDTSSGAPIVGQAARPLIQVIDWKLRGWA